MVNGWKTKLFALVVGLLGAVEVMDPNLVASLFGESYRGYVLIILGAVTALIKEAKTKEKL